MIYALILTLGTAAIAQPLGWFDTRENCVAAAREAADIIDLSPDDDAELSCIAYSVTKEKDL